MEIKVMVDIPAVQALADALRYAVNKDNEPIPYAPTEKGIEAMKEIDAQPEDETPDIPTEEAPEQPKGKDEPKYTLEQVRAKLAALAQAGKQIEVKKLITCFDVKKLTDIPESKYPVLMEKAEKIS